MGQRAIFRSDSLYVVSVAGLMESASRIEPTSSGGFGNAALFDGTESIVRGTGLELGYLSYPADAPVPTTRRLIRIN